MKSIILLLTIVSHFTFGQNNSPQYNSTTKTTTQSTGVTPKAKGWSLTDTIAPKSPIFKFETGRVKFKNLLVADDTSDFEKVLVMKGDSLFQASKSLIGGGGSATIDTTKQYYIAQGRGSSPFLLYFNGTSWVKNDTSYIPITGTPKLNGDILARTDGLFRYMGYLNGAKQAVFRFGHSGSTSTFELYSAQSAGFEGKITSSSSPTESVLNHQVYDPNTSQLKGMFFDTRVPTKFYGDYIKGDSVYRDNDSLRYVQLKDADERYASINLDNGKIPVGDGTGKAFGRTPSGDVTMNNLGVFAIDSINGITKNYYDPTSSIQTQLNSKQATISLTRTGAIGAASYSNPTINIPRGYDELSTLGSLLSYTGTQWNSSSTWNIASAGGSFTYGSSKLALSGSVGTTTFTNYVFNTTVLGTSASYLSNLDTHEEIIQCSPTTTPSATTYGFSVGLIPQGVCYQTGLAIKVDWTSTNFGKIYIFVNGGAGYQLSATSNNGLATATAGDGYSLSIKTIKGNITATLTCTSSATAANVGQSSYVTLTNTVPSTYVYGFFQHGGTTDITYLACNSQLATGAEVCFIGTSITRGSTPVDVNYRYADVISQNCKGRFIINAGNGNCSADAYYTSTQVLSLAPKTIFIEIGINDWAFGVSNATYMSNLALLVGTFTSNGYTLGVNLFIISIPPTDSDVSGVIQTWNTTLRSTYPSAYIDIYTELKSSSNPNNLSTFYNSGDNLHWNTLGHQTVAKLLINRLPSVFVTKDVNRAGFQPLLFSQHSLNKAGLLSISALGIGSSNPQAVVHAVGTTGIRVDRDGTNHTNLTTGATGVFSVAPSAGQTIIAGNSTNNALLVSDASNANGAIIGLVGGGANPSKFIRANAGNFEVINNAFSSVLMSISNAGDVSIGGVVPSAKLHVTSTTAQLRLDYSSSFHTTFTTSSAGNLSITPNGGNVTLTGAGGSTTLLNLSDPSNSIGCNIRLQGGGSNPSKYIRANAGNLEVVNNAYNSIIFGIADDGTATLNGGLVFKSYTVATLPTPVTNMMVVVTDALAPTYNATVVGGGAERITVLWNGSAWKCH